MGLWVPTALRNTKESLLLSFFSSFLLSFFPSFPTMTPIPFSFSVWTSVGSWIATSFLSSFPWVALFIVIPVLTGFRQYYVTDADTARRIQRRLVLSSSIADNDKATGWAVGWWFLVHFDQRRYGSQEIEFHVWILATPATYLRLTEQPTIVTNSVTPKDAIEQPRILESVTILQRTGTFYSVDFLRRSIVLNRIPRPTQQRIIDMIQSHLKDVGHCVAFLHGVPGAGKSLVGLLLAQTIRATYCNNLRPWQPGDTLARLHAEASPSQESPLVVLLDEIDNALVAIHAGIPPHKNYPVSVLDKQGWNSLFDDINHGMYPWTVVLLTSNRSPDFVRGLDPSYIRPGRVDIIEEL